MKIKKTIQVTDFNKEDISQLLSDAFTGGDILALDWEEDDYVKAEGECIEDKVADILLKGGCIYVIDYEADGEGYGTLERRVVENGAVRYKVTLKDFYKGFENELAQDYLYDLAEGNDDYFTGFNLIQIITFGDIIYG